MKKLKLGVSSCLLGESVRYNAEHKRDSNVIDLLGQQFEAVPVCPEVELGMGVPREPVRLVANDASSERMVGSESGKDWTQAMVDFNSIKLEALRQQNMSGFIFKSRSPSCGPGNVPLHHEQEKSSTVGLFAHALMQYFPSLPVIDEEALQDEIVRQDFVARVIQYGEKV